MSSSKQMKNYNDQLDHRFSSLLKAVDLSDAELENIADAPDLFRSIRTQIRTEQIAREAKPFRLDWKNFTLWNWQRAGVLATLLIAFAMGLIGFFSREYDSSPSVAHETVVPLDVSQPADSNLTPKTFDAPARQPIEIGIARESNKRRKPTAKSRSTTGRTRVESEEVGEFYALPYAADLAESDENGEIVRVQLPRSSLLAMGVEVQIENQNTDSIKADLLIGEDGLMKAVRVVDK